MDSNHEKLVNHIQKTLIKKVTFDIHGGSKGKNIKLTNREYLEISKEAEKYDMSKSRLNEIIQDSIEKISLGPIIKEEFKIIPNGLSMGQHIKLYTDDGNGCAIEEFIHIGDNKFILVHHERGSLLIGDELKSTTSPWNVGGRIDFEVYRNGERVIREEKYNVYRTRKLIKIQLLDPQFEYDSVDFGD